MNPKKMISLFILSFLFIGPGCYAEDPMAYDVQLSAPAPAPAPASAPAPAAAQVTGQWSDGWYMGAEGYDEAVEEYKRTNGPMLVYMTVGWCPYCRQFEKKVLSSSVVRNFLKDKIKVSINPESGERERALSFQYGIQGFPSLFLHPPQPARPLRFPTNVEPEQFVKLFQESV